MGSKNDVKESKRVAEPVDDCVVCFEPLADEADERTIVRLRCSHKFHLDCIGSTFNSKKKMICPSCRQVEKGQWLYAQPEGPYLPTPGFNINHTGFSDQYRNMFGEPTVHIPRVSGHMDSLLEYDDDSEDEDHYPAMEAHLINVRSSMMSGSGPSGASSVGTSNVPPSRSGNGEAVEDPRHEEFLARFVNNGRRIMSAGFGGNSVGTSSGEAVDDQYQEWLDRYRENGLRLISRMSVIGTSNGVGTSNGGASSSEGSGNGEAVPVEAATGETEGEEMSNRRQ